MIIKDLVNFNQYQRMNISYGINQKTSLILFFLGWLGLWVFALIIAGFLPTLVPLFLDESNTAIFLESLFFFQMVNFLTYLSLFFIGFAILLPYLKETFIPALISFKWMIGIPFTFAILFTSYLMMTFYQWLGITLEDNQNQAAIVQLVIDAPLISFLTFGLLGPIVEEWTYRLGLFKVLKEKNRALAYGVTLTIFGLIHFDFTALNLLNELLNLPIYLIAGAWFCFLYDRFGLQVAMATHITNNVLSVLSIITSANLGSSSLL
jgi:membrane protease YdiL (CAAX protease family)